jgi:hypothetical protein
MIEPLSPLGKLRASSYFKASTGLKRSPRETEVRIQEETNEHPTSNIEH